MKNFFNKEKIERLLQFTIEEFPELYQAAENENIILFIGAGISKLYGCHLWTEMAIHLCSKLKEENILNYAESDILLQDANINPRKVISICKKICDDIGRTSIYYDAIKESVTIKNENLCKDICNKIFSINATLHITTNIDLGLKNYASEINRAGERVKTYNCTLKNDLDKIRTANFNIIKDGNIIYLHGNSENIDNCILTVEQYLYFYRDNAEFLDQLFSEIKRDKSFIIFLGYSLNEWDIIERIYKIKEFSNERVGILLCPTFEHNLTKLSLELNYYRSFGVDVIPYIIDEHGYKKINIILDNLSRAISKNFPETYEIFKQIEEV